jgi:Nucleoside-diphosphate-sugar epimerases
MKTALVLGGAGFIGRHVANSLQASGYGVTVIDKATHGDNKLNPSIQFILADIRNLDFCRPYDIVYHLAATSSTDESFVYPEEYIATNIWGTYNVVKAFPNSRVVFSSSFAATDPHNVYGITKKSAEHFINLHKNSVAVRFMNVFGEGQTDIAQAIPSFCTTLKQNKKLSYMEMERLPGTGCMYRILLMSSSG